MVHSTHFRSFTLKLWSDDKELCSLLSENGVVSLAQNKCKAFSHCHYPIITHCKPHAATILGTWYYLYTQGLSKNCIDVYVDQFFHSTVVKVCGGIAHGIMHEQCTVSVMNSWVPCTFLVIIAY
jgi:hypothetical protein